MSPAGVHYYIHRGRERRGHIYLCLLGAAGSNTVSGDDIEWAPYAVDRLEGGGGLTSAESECHHIRYHQKL